MNRAEMLAAVRDFHTAWARDAVTRAKPQAKYQTDKPSQYPETLVDLSAARKDEAAYWAGVDRIMQQYYAGIGSVPVVEGKSTDVIKAIGLYAQTKAGRNIIGQALSDLDDMPDVEQGEIAVPWPVMTRPKLDEEVWAESLIEDVRIDSLYASQETLNRERVEYYVKNPGSIEEGRRAYANVYGKMTGEERRLVIVDGHHRLAALWLLGADVANVWYLED